jgi:dTDP-3,4-didehydro-2,6-dideoxy-alpha-D-glucose 3-reductase
VDKIRFGVIGCGYIARKAFIPALKKSKPAELVAVASRNSNKAKSFSVEFECDYENNYELLLNRNDISAVYIATVPSTHEEIIISAAKNRKHILCEKPLTVSYKSAKKIVDYCKKKGVGILEGFTYQLHSQHQMAQNIINEGKIGTPILLQAQFGFPPLKSDNFRYNKELGGGAILDAGSYTLHLARNFFKKEPVEVYSIIDYNKDGIDIHGTVLLNFHKGQTANLSFGFDNFYRNNYSVWGTKGYISVMRSFSIPETFKPKIILEKQDYYEEIECNSENQFVSEIEYFCKNFNNKNIVNSWRNDALAQANLIDIIKKQNKKR